MATVAAPAQRAVFAYDMADPRRARHVRAVLQSLSGSAQFSVFDTWLTHSEVHAVIAEVAAECDLSADRLVVWRPAHGARLEIGAGVPAAPGRRNVGDGQPLPMCEPALSCSDFVVCYDIARDASRQVVAALLERASARLQRSVYWLRVEPRAITGLLATLAPHVEVLDRLWCYPLARAGDLWHVGAGDVNLLPMSNHNWPREHTSWDTWR